MARDYIELQVELEGPPLVEPEAVPLPGEPGYRLVPGLNLLWNLNLFLAA